MKNILLSTALFFTASVVAQTDAPLKSFASSPAFKNHIESVMKKAMDTTYKYVAIPTIAEKTMATGQHLPYPVLFIHGLNSSSDAWLTFYTDAMAKGWSYGGTLPYCLNTDGNLYYSNMTDITDFSGVLQPSDFYLLNFNVDANGTAYGSNYNTSTQSNMAAAVKQGFIMKSAINHILQATGRDKVVLVCHSMGGLASREYIQNTSNWQTDNQHHIAKLVMSGTPNGGSDATGTWVTSAFTPDESSDAVRDLRTDYFYSGDPGVYLYGGLEDNTVMDDQLFSNFYNVDVNCNGVGGDMIVGLNQKTLSQNLDFSSIIGNWWADPTGVGDGVVDVSEAQIKNFYTVVSETYTVNANHLDLTRQIKETYLGLDEPDYSQLAYTVQTNTNYIGYITQQATDAQFTTIDYDYFTFSLPQAGSISVFADNIVTPSLGIKIIDATNTQMFNQTYSSYPVQSSPITLNAGQYTLEFSGNPTDSSWKYAYNFIINYTPAMTTLINNYTDGNTFKVWPNPSANEMQVALSVSNVASSEIKIYNINGELIETRLVNNTCINQRFDVSKWQPGYYTVSVKNETNTTYKKFCKIN